MRSPVGSRPNRGFTVVELLVVLACASVLLALMMPVLLAAREKSRRIACLNNLKQVTTGLLNYEVQHGVLPPGVINPDGPVLNEPAGFHVSWICQVLSTMEQRQLSVMVGFEVNGAYGASASGTAITSLLCPSDAIPATTSAPGSSYAGCTGGEDVPTDSKLRGVLFLNSSIRTDLIPDGMTNTTLVAERQWKDVIGSVDLGWASGTSATLRNTGVRLRGASVNTRVPSLADTDSLAATGGFGSMHSNNSVAMASCDGSVRVIDVLTDPDVLRRMGNRDDVVRGTDEF